MQRYGNGTEENIKDKNKIEKNKYKSGYANYEQRQYPPEFFDQFIANK